MALRKRIVQALAANSFGQAVNIGAQLLLTPLYFVSWGAAQFGEWLLLSTLPAYLMLADVGIGSAAANEMVMRASAGDHRAAQNTFWGAVRISHMASLLCLAVTLLGALLTATVFELPLHEIARSDASAIIVLLGLGVCLNFYLGNIGSGFRSAEKNALGILVANSLRLVEFVVAAAMLLWHATPLVLCGGLLLVRCVSLLLQGWLLHAACGWLFTPDYTVDRSLMARLLKPSLSFLALPLGNAMALQAPLVLIGLLFGSTAVAAFSTLRTLSRIPLQIANVFNASVWPEMSAAFGAGNLALMRMLHQRSWLLTLALGLGTSTALLLLGRTVLEWWLGQDGLYDAAMLLALTSMAALASQWGVSAMVLTATNAHSRMVAIYLGVNSACLALAWVLGSALGKTGFLLPLVLAELVMLCVAAPMALRATGDSLPAFVRSEWKSLGSALHLLRA
jgi:O-antigen/teichoic acid export membrane protein